MTIKYINNRELIAEIQRSKATYGYFVSSDYHMYDVVLTSLEALTPELLVSTIATKAAKMSTKAAPVDPKSINPESIVFRVMTDAHLPPETDEKRRRKSNTTGEWVVKPNFPPFKHYIMRDGEPVEVGRSHWKDGFHNGVFTIDQGRITKRLAQMFMLLVEQYSHRGNWRGYSYVDEMRSHALMHLSQVALQFDESRSDNPFAFYTQIIKHCLSGETMILTREYGSIAIEDVAEQDVHLLDGNGDWVQCHIYDHGVQETQLTYFQGDNQRIGIWSTVEHGWVSDGKIVKTKDFAGHNTKINDLRPSKIVSNDESYRKGVIHGLIYGDGHYQRENGFCLQVCSHSESIVPYMAGYSWWINSQGYPQYYVGKAWADLKAFPEQPGTDLDYLLGFFRGWFAADGCVSKVPTPTLCGDVREYEWLKKWGPLVGWHVNSYTKLAEETNFGKRKKVSLNFHLRKSSMDADDFLIEQHRKRWLSRPMTRKGTVTSKYDWEMIKEWHKNGMSTQEIVDKLEVKVTLFRSSYSQHKKAIREANDFERSWYVYGSKQPIERRLEKVYCPIVPTTHTFALNCGIQSENCFTRILNLEKRNQNIRDDLLLMAGAQPSYTRQVDNEIEQREELPYAGGGSRADPERNLIKKESKEPKKRGRKPKVRV
jgi:hypothetical protein